MKKQIMSVLLVAFLMNSFSAQAGKEEARDVATGATAVGAAAALIPTGATQAAGIGAIAGQGIGLVGMGLWNTFFSCISVPNPDFTDPATVVPVAFTQVSGTGPVPDAVNQSLMIGGQLIDQSRLVYESLRKYYGALNAGDNDHATLQRNLSLQFLSQLKNTLLAYRNSLVQISALMPDIEFGTVSVTVADVLALRDQIVTQHAFPPYEQFVYNEMNATPQEIDWAIQEVAQATGTTISDADLNGSVIFERYATALGFVNLDELMPIAGESIPTLSQWGLIILGFLLLTVGSIYLFRKKSLQFRRVE